MLGSVIGDIAGSIYEFNNIKTKDFELFTPQKTFTDDSILSYATADWLLHGGNIADIFVEYVRRYPNPMGAYGTGFLHWAHRQMAGGVAMPYNSCGNGSAMRVGPVGWAFDTLEATLDAAKRNAEVTHNHPEGIKGAQAVVAAIFMFRNGADKEEVRRYVIRKFCYDLSFTCDKIRAGYGWGALCQDTVPQSIVSVLDATDFVDAIRNAVSLGGDSDTLACITGSMAEALFGIPYDVYRQGRAYLDDRLSRLTDEFEMRYGRKVV